MSLSLDKDCAGDASRSTLVNQKNTEDFYKISEEKSTPSLVTSPIQVGHTRENAGNVDDIYAAPGDNSFEYCVNKLACLENKLTSYCNVLEEMQKDTEDARQASFFCEAKTRCLENQLKEIGSQVEEKHELDQQQFREMILKHERRNNKEIEKYAKIVHNIRQECSEIKQESVAAKSAALRAEEIEQGLKKLLERISSEEEKMRAEINDLRSVFEREVETATAERKLILNTLRDLGDNLDGVREDLSATSPREITSPHPCGQCVELERKLKVVTDQCDELVEANDELYAKLLVKGAREGEMLLQREAEPLSAELEKQSKNELIEALKKEKQLNADMRDYVARILLSVMEHYPCLLEVKAVKSQANSNDLFESIHS